MLCEPQFWWTWFCIKIIKISITKVQNLGLNARNTSCAFIYLCIIASYFHFFLLQQCTFTFFFLLMQCDLKNISNYSVQNCFVYIWNCYNWVDFLKCNVVLGKMKVKLTIQCNFISWILAFLLKDHLGCVSYTGHNWTCFLGP